MILVTGCRPLGAGLVKALESQQVKGACDASNPDIVTGYLTYDFEKEQDIFMIVDREKPEAIVMTEEIENAEYCEENRLDAMYYNTRATRYFAEAAQKIPARLIYKSSAMVFDGRKPGGMYTEEDSANPINVYAETKLMGETAVDRTRGFLIVRPGELYGAYADNFASQIYDSLVLGEKVELASDMYFSPVYIDDAIAAIKLLTINKLSGFYNVAGAERMSHYEFGQRIARTFGFSEDMVSPLPQADLGLAVRMPKDISLDNSKMGALMNFRSFDDGLAAMKAIVDKMPKN